MPDVLVSFVVPAHNEEALIGSCLTAISAEISRTGCPAEIIVVDNRSSDGTRRIASAVPGVKVIDEPQRGLVQARQAGCRVAQGKYIANIDADTILGEGWLQRALAEFAKTPGLIALSGPYTYYDLPAWARLVAAGFFRGVHIIYLLSRVVAGAGSVMQGGNFIVSRSGLERIGGINPDFRFHGEDAELARRLAKVGKVKFTFALQALSSGRRLAGEGVFKVLLRYSVNYLWTHLFQRPFSTDWLDFRHTVGITAVGRLPANMSPDVQGTRASPDMLRRNGRW
jgi:glycosyltransferase involved in cell wall biosynthesis